MPVDDVQEVFHLLSNELFRLRSSRIERRFGSKWAFLVPSLPESHEAIDHVSRPGQYRVRLQAPSVGMGVVNGIVIGPFARRAENVESTGWPRRCGTVFVL